MPLHITCEKTIHWLLLMTLIWLKC